MKVISAIGLKKYYETNSNIVRALDNVSFEVDKGEFVAIVGMSGSGKSTLLHLLGGLDKPTEGKVIVNGNDITKMNGEALTKFRRRHVGFVFQSYNLVPILSIYENIVLPVVLDNKAADEKYVNALLKFLRLEEKRNCLPNQLSGGQQQRVAIARALAAKPSILLADEPTGNLDSKTRQDVLNILKITSVKLHQTILMITHDEQIASLADRVIQIEDGKLKKDGGCQ